jgi:hypothetical protein
LKNTGINKKLNIMAGTMKNQNRCPEVVTKPTQYKGGISAYPTVVTNPTKYTGGLNKAACDIPTGKLKK